MKKQAGRNFNHIRLYEDQKKIDQMKLASIKPLAIFFLFLTLGFGIYSNTLEAPFYFDDKPGIIENPHIRITNLSFNAIKNIGFNSVDSSRPIANISFAINYYFHQYHPKGYHVVNIIIHVLTGFLLYLFIKTTLSIPVSKSSSTVIPESVSPACMAFFAALIWLVNPVHTQSVTYIVQRMNSMAAMFIILSLLLYAQGRMIQHLQITSLQHDKNTPAIKEKTAFSFQRLIPGLYFAGAVLSWMLALGSKQNAAMLPFFIFLYEWYFFQDLSKDWLKHQLKYVFGVVILFSLIALIYLGTNPFEKLKSITDYAYHEFTLTERVLTQPRVVIYYLSLIFFPHPSRLNLDYDFPLSHSLIDPITTLFSLCIIFGIIGLAIYIAKKERLISFCILWFFGNLVIESSVIPLAIIYEHRTYLPSMLVCLLFIILGQRYIKLKWPGVVLICFITAVFSVWTYQRNNIWRDPVALWSDCVAKSPQKARPHYNLGLAFSRQGRGKEVIYHYLQALRIKPDFVKARYNLGNALEKQGRTEEAIEHFKETLRIKPDFVEAHINLGKALGKQGRTEEATEHFLAALRINPDDMEAHYNLGNALGGQGRTEEAIEHFLAALRIKPDDEQVHYNLGIALFRTGNTQEAITHFRKAVRIKPDFEEALYNLGTVLFNTRKTDEAIVYLQKALQMNPNNAGTHVTLGAALINKGEIATAISHFREALRLNPGYAAAQGNLMQASAILNKIDVAIADIKTDLIFYPENSGSHYKLGKLYQSKGDLNAAADEYQKALSIEPGFVEALNNLASIYMTKNENDKTLSLLNKLTVLQPDNPGHYYNLARVYAVKNLTQESIGWLHKAIEKGYNNWDLIKTDKNLENIRGSAYYKELIKDR